VLPLERDTGSVLDACLGAALARSLERKIAAGGARVLASRAGTRACEALGLEPPLDEDDARAVLRHAGATHLVQGRFEREAGALALSLQLCLFPALGRGGEEDGGDDAPEPRSVASSGEAASFQEVLDRAAR